MHGLGDVFGELFAQRGVGRNSEQGRRRGFTREIVIEEAKHLQPPPPPVPEQQHQSQFAPQDNTPKGASEKDRLLKIFNLEGEVLELRENRLKAKSAADYYKRLTYLFIYAQETLLGRSSTPKSELVTVLKSAKVYDPNCRYWLTQKKGFTVDAEDRMKLIAGAREQAVKALDEISDSNVADEWNPDTRTVKARTPRKKKP